MPAHRDHDQTLERPACGCGVRRGGGGGRAAVRATRPSRGRGHARRRRQAPRRGDPHHRQRQYPRGPRGPGGRPRTRAHGRRRRAAHLGARRRWAHGPRGRLRAVHRRRPPHRPARRALLHALRHPPFTDDVPAALSARRPRPDDRGRRGVHAGDSRRDRLHVTLQLGGEPGDVGAAGVVPGRPAPRRPVRGALRRRSRAVPPGRPARDGPALGRAPSSRSGMRETSMDEHGIRELLRDVSAGRLSRRGFVRAMIGFGLTAPLASQMLAAAGVAQAQTQAAVTPLRRGGGGPLKALWWDAPNMLNPILAVGLKDWNACALFYEPLVSFDPLGNMVPVLVRDVPSVRNGGVARDGTSVIWWLKRGVQWHDGKPFTAQDVVFNWEYAADPATGSPAAGVYRNVKQVEAIDPYTVKFTFTQPTPYWLMTGAIIPRHVFESYKGAKSREAPNNLKPVGTGPYRFVAFKPGDLLKAELNTTYHGPNRPFFDTVEVKGGGDAVSAARAVLQTGEYDYAWNLQVEDDVLRRLERGGKGRVVTTFGGTIEHLLVNQTDPWREMDGERSSTKSVHPFLTDPAV